LAKLDEHVADGLAEIRDDAVVLMPQGYLMMRNVAMAFDAYLGCEQRGGSRARSDALSSRLSSGSFRCSTLGKPLAAANAG
jgi:hypothetical protein